MGCRRRWNNNKKRHLYGVKNVPVNLSAVRTAVLHVQHNLRRFWRVTMEMQKLKFCCRHANGNLLTVKMNKTLALSQKQCSTWPSSQTDEGQVLKRVFLRFCHFHTPSVLMKCFFFFYTVWRSTNYLIIGLIYWRSLRGHHWTQSEANFTTVWPFHISDTQVAATTSRGPPSHHTQHPASGRQQIPTSEPTMAKKHFPRHRETKTFEF